MTARAKTEHAPDAAAPPIRAALYTRISRDPTNQGLGVDRQYEDGQLTAARHGWQVVGEYRDNDRSASNGKPRPEFEKMIRDFQAGQFEAVIVWNADRLTRDVIEGEKIIELAERRGLRLASVAGETDLATADGRTMFRIKVAMSKAETERSSERIKRQRDQAAREGRPHGMVAYGYRREDVKDDKGRVLYARDVIDEAEADVIREVARRLLAGESLRSVTRAMNDQGSTSPRGIPWSSTTLRQVMLRDRNAGLRRHRGKVVGRGDWEPILDEGTHDRVKASLTDPARTTGAGNKGATRKHLLSGLLRCGRCDGGMRVIPGGVHDGKKFAAKYQCKECFRVARRKDLVEDVVTAVVIERLAQPDAITALATGRPERAAELRNMIDAANARLDIAADGFADGTLSAEQLRRIGAKLRPQIDEWRVEMASCAPHDGILDVAGPEAADRWHAAPLDVQRTIIDLLMTVTVLPVGPGRRFDPDDVRTEEDGRVIVFSDQIKVKWKGAA